VPVNSLYDSFSESNFEPTQTAVLVMVYKEPTHTHHSLKNWTMVVTVYANRFRAFVYDSDAVLIWCSVRNGGKTRSW